jgi:hypothetical protein
LFSICAFSGAPSCVDFALNAELPIYESIPTFCHFCSFCLPGLAGLPIRVKGRMDVQLREVECNWGQTICCFFSGSGSRFVWGVGVESVGNDGFVEIYIHFGFGCYLYTIVTE